MGALQRRMLAGCVFALAFILFYEARGERLVNLWGERDRSEAAIDIFKQNALTGAIVLVLGTGILFGLRRQGAAFEFSGGELVAMALGLGLLMGTLAMSWLYIST